MQATTAAPAAQAGDNKKKLTKWEKLQQRVKQDPVVYGFLGLTVAALTGGLISLYRDNKKQSQVMMRARVCFQFMTVTSLLGGVYYRAYSGQMPTGGATSVDKRTYMNEPSRFTQDVGSEGESGTASPLSIEAAEPASDASRAR